jgi:hypothetical protein
MKQLQRAYTLTVLLVHVDVEEVIQPLADITKAAVLHDCTLVCAWSHEVRQGGPQGRVLRLGGGGLHYCGHIMCRPLV